MNHKIGVYKIISTVLIFILYNFIIASAEAIKCSSFENVRGSGIIYCFSFEQAEHTGVIEDFRALSSTDISELEARIEDAFRMNNIRKDIRVGTPRWIHLSTCAVYYDVDFDNNIVYIVNIWKARLLE